MELINLSESKLSPKYVNPEQVDAVVADDGDTIVYAGQYVYKVENRIKRLLICLERLTGNDRKYLSGKE